MIIKQSNYESEQKTLGIGKDFVNFDNMKPRGDFVKNYCKLIPSDKRFEFHRDLDKSTFLSKNQRVKTRQFSGYAERKTFV